MCGSEVIVLDEQGNALAGTEGAKRFETFEEGACPVFAALAPASDEAAGTPPKSVDQPDDPADAPAAANLPGTTVRPRPVLRLISRLRHDVAGRRA